jgi:hypothetical protein
MHPRSRQPPPPSDPKPSPPRPQKRKQSAGNKRPKHTPAQEVPPDSAASPAPMPNPPIKYNVTGLLSARERFAEDINSIEVTLTPPSPDEECPIALEAISTAELSFLPGCSFFKDRPDYSKMTLPCGHSFSAMVLIYNWCKSNMLCPCCRRGLDCRANINYLPTHFREQIKAQVASSLTAERIEDERESIQAILDMTPMTLSFADLAIEGCLEMTIGFYFNPNWGQAIESSNPLDPPNQRPTSRGHFRMITRLTTQTERRGDRQAVPVFRPLQRHMDVLRMPPSGVTSITVTTQMRIIGAGLVDVDSSGEIDFPVALPSTGEAQDGPAPLIVRRANGYRPRDAAQSGAVSSLPVIPVSTFEITFNERGGVVFLDNVAWIPDSTHVRVALHMASEA